MSDELAREINVLMLEADQLHASVLQLRFKIKRLKCGYDLQGRMDNATAAIERVVEYLTDAEETAKEYGAREN